MSDGEQERNAVRLVRRSIERHVPGLGACVFTAPGVATDMRLAIYYSAAEPDVRAFVNELIAAVVQVPVVDAADVDALTERGRAIARVAVAEAAGCDRAYRRHAGSGLTGDERLFRAMRERHEENLERVRDAVGAMNDNVVRIVERTRRTLLDSGALDFVERNRRQIEQFGELYTRAFRPNYLDEIKRINRQFEEAAKPPIFDQFLRPDSTLNVFGRRYARVAENAARQLQSVVRPTYFGGLERISQQMNEAFRPAQVETLTRVVEQLRRAIRPQYLDRVARIAAQVEEVIKPRYLEQIAALSQRVREVATTPLFASLRDGLLRALEAYATFLERRYPKVFANPEHPPPFLFVVASLPLWVAVPLLDALVAGDDEPLLERLEEAIHGTTLVDIVQAALQQTPSLDELAKRHLVQALDHVRDQRYVDAEPPLYQGLERAFRDAARRRGILDPEKESLVGGDRRARARVDEFLGYLIDDPRYLRFLRSWVFGPLGDAARHGGLAEEQAYRRWVLRAFVAVVGWLKYCAADAEPMRALIARLELGRGDVDAAEDIG
jgi:hypothetical protein